jgi:class 3 adenylate cyclase/tetratricopeptide (TPR) repeat protein
MGETRKLAAILVADVVGYSRLAGADEERTLADLRAIRSDLIDPIIAVHHGRVVKRTGDGSLIEFRSVVDAVRCAIEVQSGLMERNAGMPEDRRIQFRVGIHVGDVVEESDGDLMGDGVNIAARLESIAKPGGVCLSEDAWRQLQGKVEANFADAGEQRLKNIVRPVRAFHLESRATETGPLLSPFARRVVALGSGRTPGDSNAPFFSRNRALMGLLILIGLAGSVALVRIWPAAQMTDAEQTRLIRTPTKNLEAYDYYLRAENEGLYNGVNAAPARAMASYAKAIELDPNFADAQAGFALAAAQVLIFNFDFFASSTVTRKRAYTAAGRALELDPNNGRAYVALAALQLGDGRHTDAITSARRAAVLAPRDPRVFANLGMILAFAGESTEAVAEIEQARRLSPSPPPDIRLPAGIVFYNARQYEQAIEEMKAVISVWPAAGAPHEYLSAAYAHLGKLDLARSEARQIPDSVFPKPSLAFARLIYGLIYKRAEDRNHHLEGLKAAGIPEWPFGFEGRLQDQVTGEALAALAVGHAWAGRLFVGTPFILQVDSENRFAFRTGRSLVAGVIRLENDQLCMQFDGYVGNLWFCGGVYRTVAASGDASVDYIYVRPDELMYFSVKD